MKIFNVLHALVARKIKDFSRRLNCLIVNVLFFKLSGKEFHAVGPVQEKAHLPLPGYLIVDILEHRGRHESRAQLTASFVVAGLPVQFRQVWRCHVVWTFVDHDTESERDALWDVEPM